jgi:hypothetical protein
MRPRIPEILRRWVVPAALLALVPKCVLCALAYAGLGAALGGPEICGAPDGAAGSWTAWLLPAFGLAAGAVGLHARSRVKLWEGLYAPTSRALPNLSGHKAPPTGFEDTP